MLQLFLFLLSGQYVSQASQLTSTCSIKAKEIIIDGHLQCTNIYAFNINQQNLVTISEDKIIADQTNVQHIFIGDLTSLMLDDGGQDQVLTFESQVILQTGMIRTSHLISSSFTELLQKEQWRILHHDDFETDSSLVGWNIPQRSYCDIKQRRIKTSNLKQDKQADSFITTHCTQQEQNLTKLYSVSPPHKHVKITSEIHVFGDWVGETILMLIDGKIAWSRTFQSYDSQEMDHPCPQLQAYSIPIEAVIDQDGEQIQVTFSSTNKRHPCDGSFAIDDLILYFK